MSPDEKKPENDEAAGRAGSRREESAEAARTLSQKADAEEAESKTNPQKGKPGPKKPPAEKG